MPSAVPPGESATGLPSGVQAQIVALASDALGRLPAAQVPAPLRSAATFAPSRRARLVGRQILAALTDDDFREQVATQVKALVPTTVAALGDGTPMPPAELSHAAAVAFLVRGPGWTDVIESAAEQERQRDSAGAGSAVVERLTGQLSQARSEAKAQREKLRAQVEALKSDNATLRRTLGQVRTELRDARTDAVRAQEALDEVRREAEVESRALAAESRRLRARLTELEAESSASRRAARDDRDAEVVRLRLLLETMVESANGIRRELALPPSTGLPADLVAALEPDAPSAASQIGRALMSDDPVLLRRLLELPKLHLVVDGYNVSKQAWPSAPLEQQRTRLVAGLAGLMSGKNVETTVVFDGADLLHTPAVASPRGVRVRFSPPGVIADDVIRQLVAAEPSGRPVVVVSTDREVAESITKMGARSVASSALAAVIGR